MLYIFFKIFWKYFYYSNELKIEESSDLLNICENLYQVMGKVIILIFWTTLHRENCFQAYQAKKKKLLDDVSSNIPIDFYQNHLPKNLKKNIWEFRLHTNLFSLIFLNFTLIPYPPPQKKTLL